MESTEDSLFVGIAPPPKRKPRFRKKLARRDKPVTVSALEHLRAETVVPCNCRFCTTDEITYPYDATVIQILKACVIKILLHCFAGCLQDDGDEMDGAPLSEEEMMKSLCSRISRPETLWLIMTIAARLDKRYVSCYTLDELMEFIQCIEKNPRPMDVMAKIGAELPVALKRLICQNVTGFDYNKLLIKT